MASALKPKWREIDKQVTFIIIMFKIKISKISVHGASFDSAAIANSKGPKNIIRQQSKLKIHLLQF